MDNNSQQKENNALSTALKGIALILGMFILGNIIGSLTNVKRVNNFETVNNQTAITDSTVITTLPTTTQPSTVQTTTETPTTQPTTSKITTTAVTTTQNTTADRKTEIVALFNQSANKVKKSAKKVTRNYESLRFDKKKSDIPVPLYLSGKPLINSWLIDHEIPVEYSETELIKANFPVKGKDWSSRLTAKDVANATMREENGRYHILLELADCTNPGEGKGVCSVMEEVNTAKVRELADIVKTCETEYYDCRVECIIEKASGNMIYVKYTEPMKLNLTAGRVAEMSAVFAMTIESEFEIAY